MENVAEIRTDQPIPAIGLFLSEVLKREGEGKEPHSREVPH